MRHVARGGNQGRGRNYIGIIHDSGHESTFFVVVSDGEIAKKLGRNDETALAHIQGLEDVVLYILREGHAGSCFHDVSRNRKITVRVRVLISGRRHAGSPAAREIRAEWNLSRSGARSEADSAIVESGGMRQQILKRDRVRIIFLELEKTQIVIYVFIQPQFSLIHKLQDGDRGEGLRDRREAEDGALRIHRDFLLQVRVAVAFEGDDFAVFHDGNHSARVVKLFHVGGEILVQESSHILRIQRHPGGGLRPRNSS